MPIWHGDDWHSPAPNLMFVRLRTSATNLHLIDRAVAAWTAAKVPVVITFMAYYDHEPVARRVADLREPCYEWRVRHINSYWCPTQGIHAVGHVPLPGQPAGVACAAASTSRYCRACRNCETRYLQTMKRLRNE